MIATIETIIIPSKEEIARYAAKGATGIRFEKEARKYKSGYIDLERLQEVAPITGYWKMSDRVERGGRWISEIDEFGLIFARMGDVPKVSRKVPVMVDIARELKGVVFYLNGGIAIKPDYKK